MTAPPDDASVPVLRIATRIATSVVTAAGCAAVVALLALAVTASTHPAAGQTWQGDYTDTRGLASWLIAQVTEPQFYAVTSASLGLLAGGVFAHLAQRSSRRWAGFVQACGTGIWPPVVGSALASLVLGVPAWGWTLQPRLWQPLFVPIVAAAPAMVVLYGPGSRKASNAHGQDLAWHGRPAIGQVLLNLSGNALPLNPSAISLSTLGSSLPTNEYNMRPDGRGATRPPARRAPLPDLL